MALLVTAALVIGTLPAAAVEVQTGDETESHLHSEACYGAVMVCTEEAQESHAHSDDCSGLVLSCAETEHIHSSECYDEEGYLICDASEHAHEDACYQPVLTCVLEEREGHIHTENCYERQLVCGYADEEADIEEVQNEAELSEEELAATASLENLIDEFLSAHQLALEDGDERMDALNHMREEITEAYDALSPEAQALVSNYSSFLDVADGIAVTADKPWEESTVAVIVGSDGTYAQYTTLQEAVQAVASADEVTIKIVKDMTITEAIIIKNKKIKLEADEAHTITFAIPADADNRNGFQAAGYANPASLAIGGNITVTTTGDIMRSIVNVGGTYGSFSLEGGTLSSGSANIDRAIVYVNDGGTVSMSGGKIQGDKNHNSRGVFLQYYNGPQMEFTMTGGTITDCSLPNRSAYCGQGGGVLMIGNSIFTMTGGAITNCSAIGQGGGVAILDKAVFTMNGGMIDNCSSGAGGYVYAAPEASFIINGGTVGSVGEDGAAQIGDQKYPSLKAAIDAVAKGQNDATTIKIVQDITVTEAIVIENKKIKLEADEAHTITFAIPAGAENRNGFQAAGYANPASLAIGENITVTTTGDIMRSIVNVGGKYGSFSLEGGTLSSGSANIDRAIVYVNDGGMVSMSGGKIQGDKNHNSRGVFLQYYNGPHVEFTMTGGTIADCSLLNTSAYCAHGGGVLMIGNSKFTMVGGEITNCSAIGQGGGVTILDSALFTMNDGKISGCTATTKGGGVMAQDTATFILNGGEICSCKATANGSVGGGIYLSGKNINFTMSGGKVCHNTAEYIGGGIHTQSDIQITAGAIQDNKTTCAVGYGGGIYVHKEATLKLTNVLITDNTASALGGGIWSCRTGDIKIYIKDGGAIFDNSAEGGGNMKTPEQAGDDIASTVTFPAAGFLLISHRMLGGGANRYYEDGGVTGFSTEGLEHYHGAGSGLGAPDGTTARYDAAASALVTETYITEAVALKNVVSEAARAAANRDAKLIISGNSASRGGGIGTNGNLIIGTPDPDSETGNLTVEKEIAGNGQETGKEFSIQVTLKRDGGTAADITGEYGELIFINGVATVTLKAGQSITATGLPAGISYTVEETAESQDGYTVTYTNQAGTIGKDDTVIATVMNTKEAPPKPTPETGSLTVSKTVSGDGASNTKEFTFTVSLADARISGVYGGMTFENGVATFTLKDGESKTASNLPAGVDYAVVESDNEGYTVTVEGTSGTTATGTIVADTTAIAAFNNYKAGGKPDPAPEYGSLSVTKTVSGYGDTSREFTFVVTLNDPAISGDYGNMKFTSGVATVKLKHGQTVKATNLPAGVTYNVVELEANTDGYTTLAVGQGGTIQANETAQVIFNNYKSGSGGPIDSYTSVSVKKVWVLDDGGVAADSVTIALLKNGVEHKTIELSEANGWSHTWSGLDNRYTWTVQEIDVPDGFSMSVAQSGYTFTITNDDMPDTPNDPDDPDKPDEPDEPDSPDEPDKPDEPNTPDTSDTPDTPDEPDNPSTPETPGLPQTGQLWWPVVLTLVLGLALLTGGALDMRRHRYHGKHKK